MNQPPQESIMNMVNEMPVKKMDKTTRNWYLALLILSTTIFIAGLYFNKIEESIVAIPVIMVLIAMLFYDKEIIHVPPAMIFLIVITMYVAFAGSLVTTDGDILDLLTYLLIGAILGLIGLIVAYISLGKMPGFINEKPTLIAIESFTFGLAAYVIWIIIEYYVDIIFNTPLQVAPIEIMAARIVSISIGCLIISIIFFLDKQSGIFKHAVVGFLKKNSDAIGMKNDETEEILKMIKTGESDTLEFKSTLRTNLQTGEKDKRMEKAVLKTIVAFLNTNGGTLLVGVSDDGTILGMDIESFDNQDKLNLHITNLISAQIGDEFIPFIRFKLVDFDGKIVIRFDCLPTSSPVFLKDGKEEIFFVRSGPSSVELTGIDLLKYADNRKKLKKKKKYAAATPLPSRQN